MLELVKRKKKTTKHSSFAHLPIWDTPTLTERQKEWEKKQTHKTPQPPLHYQHLITGNANLSLDTTVFVSITEELR